jgi:hypothetical protein
LCIPYESRRRTRNVGETPMNLGISPTFLGQPKVLIRGREGIVWVQKRVLKQKN